MSNLRNQLQLIGNVGHAPETKNFESDKKVSTFSLATNEYYHKKGEKNSANRLAQCSGLGKQAELIEKYVDKGKEIAKHEKIAQVKNYSYTGVIKEIGEKLVKGEAPKLSEIVLVKSYFHDREEKKLMMRKINENISR